MYVFAVSLSPSPYDYHAELILNAHQITDATIRTSTVSRTVTVYGNGSYHYDMDYDMRTTTDVESKGRYTRTSDAPY